MQTKDEFPASTGSQARSSWHLNPDWSCLKSSADQVPGVWGGVAGMSLSTFLQSLQGISNLKMDSLSQRASPGSLAGSEHSVNPVLL